VNVTPLLGDLDEPFELRCEPPLLVVRFAALQRVASWAIVNGGLADADAVAWFEVRNADLPRDRDPQAYLAERLVHAGLDGAVGLLTSRKLSSHVVHDARHAAGSARCVATVGLSNALCAGDLPVPGPAAGTINLFCHVSQPLSDRALLEALALAAEARTLALLEARVPSRVSGRPATGTGTDCIVLASPRAEPDAQQPYAGKHTALGHVIATAVYRAIARGVEDWLMEQRCA